MKIYRTALLISLFFGGLASAQNQPSPAEAKLKEMVKSLTQRVSQAEQDAAKVLAEKATSDAKVTELKGQVESMTESLKKETEAKSKLQEESAKKEAELKDELKKVKEDLGAHKESLVKWKAAHTEISGIAKKKEAERAKQASIASALERRVQDLRMRNGAMYDTGIEILNRYKSFGLGEAIAAREPFTGTMRIKLKNQVQEYADALLDATADSKRVPAKAAEAQKATGTTTASQQAAPATTRVAEPVSAPGAAPAATPPTPAEAVPPQKQP